MVASPLHMLLQFHCSSFRSPSCMHNGQVKNAMAKNLKNRYSSVTVKNVPRRLFLQLMGISSIVLDVYPVLAAPVLELKEPEVIRTRKLASGVRIQGKNPLFVDMEGSVILCVFPVANILEGDGPEAQEGDIVELNYVCRRSNGYFVHSTVDQFSGESMPVILPLDENQIIKGLKDVLVGMRAGGKRRALIPPSVGYVNENLKPIPDEFGPRRSLFSHASEPLIFEVQLLKVL